MIKTIHTPHIYLPRKGVDMSKYAVIACDQYTSNLEYWDSLKEYVGDTKDGINIKDPWGYSIETYRFCAAEINKELDSLIEKIK